MKFDISRVYTAVNADELKAGDKVIVADTIEILKEKISENCELSELFSDYTYMDGSPCGIEE